jgi:heme-degrading monooxygenase HmoA
MSVSGIAEAVGVGAYAVVFTSLRTSGDDGYEQTSEEMVSLAVSQPGYLGMESARADHLTAQRAGRERWYRAFRIRVCRVEREYGFGRA